MSENTTDTPITDDFESFSAWCHKHFAKKGRSHAQIESMMHSPTGLFAFQVWEGAKDQEQTRVRSLERQLAEARKLADDAVATSRAIKDQYGLGDRHVMREKNAEIEALKSQLAEAIEARKISARESIDMVQNASKREHAAKRERDHARHQRDTLAEALRDIRSESPAATVPQWILDRIDKALATLNQSKE